MLEKISEELKQRIANSHIDGFGEELEYWVKQINTPTSNYKNMLPRDLTNGILISFCDENLRYDIVRRGFYELLLLLDLNSNLLFTCMSEDALNKILKDKKREVPHYIDILSLKNKGLEGKTHQITLPGIDTELFPEDELERQLKELCSNLELQTDKEFRHCIITIKKSGYNVQELKAYIFNSALELVEEENWSQYLKPSYTFLDDTKKSNEVDIIKPTLKKDFLVQDKDTMPEIKNDKNDENDVNEEE